MKKVGILSMQRIKNYGSFMQAFALKQIITDLNYDVQFVDYHVEEPIVKKSDLSNKIFKILKSNISIKKKIKYIIYKKNFGKKYYKLLGINNLNYTPKLDVLVIGSDEVFNCIQNNSNVGYSMELFGKDNQAKKVITYAASFGNTTYEKLEKYNKIDEISKYLQDIDYISVRDSNSGNIIEKLTSKKVQYNLDPVLIYNFENNNLIPKIQIKEKYMVLYAYYGRITDIESRYIKSFAKKNKLKIYSIGGIQKCTDKFIDCSPFEVISYLKNAEFIITDTFHGCIFSIITHKNFATLVRKSLDNKYGNEEKVLDLLERLNLKEKIIYNLNNIEEKYSKKIDYDLVDAILKKERKKTIKYLKENLK